MKEINPQFITQFPVRLSLIDHHTMTVTVTNLQCASCAKKICHESQILQIYILDTLNIFYSIHTATKENVHYSDSEHTSYSVFSRASSAGCRPAAGFYQSRSAG